jgi:hypothetical protein
MLDQSALYSIKYYFSVSHPNFRFAVMNALAGANVMDFVALVTSDEEKFEMRGAVVTPKA